MSMTKQGADDEAVSAVPTKLRWDGWELRRGRGPVFIIYTRLGRNYRLPRNSDCDELRAMHFACAAQAHAGHLISTEPPSSIQGTVKIDLSKREIFYLSRNRNL